MAASRAILEKFKIIRSNKIVRSVTVLAGGTSLAQALTVLSLPLLTRLYTPSDFSALAVYSALLGIISVAACLRLEAAIPLAESDEDAANLVVLSTVFLIAISLITTIIVVLGGPEFGAFLKNKELVPYLWMLPIGIMTTGLYSIVQFWAIRKKWFPVIAKTKLVQSISGISIQFIFGLLKSTPVGLILGQTISSGAGTTSVGLHLWRSDRGSFRGVGLSRMLTVLKRYSSYPKFSAFEVLVNTAAIQIPIILIGAAVASNEVGYLLLGMKAMQIPVSLVGGAVSQVYLANAIAEYRNNTLDIFTGRIVQGLVRIGVGPILFAGMVAEKAFPLLFGDGWQRAGSLVAWMTPWFIAQLVASPISMVMHVREKQREMLILTTSGLVLRVGFVVAVLKLSPNYASEAYAISSALFYLVCYFIFSKTAGLGTNANAAIAKSLIKSISLWGALGGACLLMIWGVNK